MIRVRTAPLVLALIALVIACAAGLSAASGMAAAAEPRPPAHALSGPLPADAFARVLFGPDTDADPAQLALLVEVGTRYCDLADAAGDPLPGAEPQTRASWTAALTLPRPSPTTGWTLEEANRFLDAAEDTLCDHSRV